MFTVPFKSCFSAALIAACVKLCIVFQTSFSTCYDPARSSSAVGSATDFLSVIKGSRVRAPARSHNFVEIDHKIISIVILFLADSRRAVISSE